MRLVLAACLALALAFGAVPTSAQERVRIEPQHVFDGGRIEFVAGGATRLMLVDSGGTVRLLDFADPARPRVALTLGDKFSAAAALPDGRLLTGGGDGMVRFWSQAGTEAEPPLPMLGRMIDHVRVSAKGRFLAAADVTGRIRLWRREGARWTAVATVEALAPSGECFFDPGVSSLAFSPDETLLAASPCPGGIAAWTTAGRQLAVTLPPSAEGGLGHHLTFSADGRHLAAHFQFQPGSLRFVWPVEGERFGVANEINREETLAIAAHPRSNGFVVADGEGILVHDAVGRPLAKLIHAARLTALAVSADGARLAAVENRRVRLWDAGGNPVPPEPFGEGGVFGAVVPLADGFATAYPDGEVRIWRWSGERAAAFRVVPARRGGEHRLDFTLALLPDRATLAAIDARSVRLFGLDGRAKGAFALPLPAGDAYPRLGPVPAFGPGDVLAANAERTALLRLGYDGRPRGDTFARQRGPILGLARRDRDGLVATTDRQELRLWSADGRALVPPIPLHQDCNAERLEFSPDGARMVIGGIGSRCFWIWRAAAPDRIEWRGGVFIGFTRESGMAWADSEDILVDSPEGGIRKLLPRRGHDPLALVPDGSGVLVSTPDGVRLRRFAGEAEPPPSLWGYTEMKSASARDDGSFRVEFDDGTRKWRVGGEYRFVMEDGGYTTFGKWRIRDNKLPITARRAGEAGDDIELAGERVFANADGSLLATIGRGAAEDTYILRLYDSELKVLAETAFDGPFYGRAALAADGSAVAVWAEDRIRLVDRTGRWLERAVAIGDSLGAGELRFAPNGRWLAAADAQHRVWLFDGEGRVLSARALTAGALRAFAIAPDSRALLVQDDAGSVGLWPVDAESGRAGERMALAELGPDHALALGFRGSRIWARRAPNEVLLLDTALRELARVYFVPDGHLAVLPDGRHCGTGLIFERRQAYRGAALLAASERDALVDCAAVKAIFDP
jgi:WD40 repeat protein